MSTRQLFCLQSYKNTMSWAIHFFLTASSAACMPLNSKFYIFQKTVVNILFFCFTTFLSMHISHRATSLQGFSYNDLASIKFRLYVHNEFQPN